MRRGAPKKYLNEMMNVQSLVNRGDVHLTAYEVDFVREYLENDRRTTCRKLDIAERTYAEYVYRILSKCGIDNPALKWNSRKFLRDSREKFLIEESKREMARRQMFADFEALEEQDLE